MKLTARNLTIFSISTFLAVAVLYLRLSNSFTSLSDANEDKNGNGVWDEVEAKIIQKYSYSKNIQNAMFQIARADQLAATEEILTVKRALEIDQMASRAFACADQIEPSLSSIGLDIEAWVVNTPERIKKYNHYNSLLSGQVFDTQSDDKSCDFEVEK